MAQNLHLILQEAKAHGVRLSVIAGKAGMADQSGKTGRLYDYRLDPGLNEDRKRRRGRRLIQHAAGYLRLAQAAADLAEFDVSDVMVRLVSGTRFEEGMDDLPDDACPEYLHMLSGIIQAQAQQIAKATRLDWYFETIDKQGLAPNGDGWEADDESWLWTHATVPSVTLFTEEIACFGGTWWDTEEREGQRKLVRVCRKVDLALAPFGDG